MEFSKLFSSFKGEELRFFPLFLLVTVFSQTGKPHLMIMMRSESNLGMESLLYASPLLHPLFLKIEKPSSCFLFYSLSPPHFHLPSITLHEDSLFCTRQFITFTLSAFLAQPRKGTGKLECSLHFLRVFHLFSPEFYSTHHHLLLRFDGVKSVGTGTKF